MTISNEKLAYSIVEVVQLTGFGRTTIYKEINAGRLRKIKLNRRAAILASDLNSWLASLAESNIKATV